MAESSNSGDSRPIPDPTNLTRIAVESGIEAAKDYADGKLAVLVERLNGIDRATRLLNETVNRTPTDIQKEVAHVEELMAEKFKSVQVQFLERDTRQERESRDNKIAVDAAFAAQKEIAAKQDESNARALEKSEKGTEKTIDGLSSKIDDLKERLVSLEARMVAIESSRVAARETKADTHEGSAITGQWIAVAIAMIALIVTVAINVLK